MFSGMAIVGGLTGVDWSPLLASTGLLVPLVGWSLVWKAIALWKAARRYHLGWFIILAIVNTAAILEIIYIFLVAKGRDDRSAMVTQTPGAG